MQPCLTLVSGSTDDRHDPVQRRPPHARPLRDRLRRQRRLRRRRPRSLIDNNPPAHPRSAALGRRRGLAARRRLRPLLVQSRPGPGEPDLGRLLADHGPGRLRHRGPVRAGAEHRLAPRSLRAGRRRLHPPPLAARRSGQRRRLRPRSRSRCASTTSRPGVAFEAAPDRDPATDLPETRSPRWSPTPTRARRAARSPSAGSAPTTGPSCRPSSCRDEAADSARLVAPLPRDLGPGIYLFRADAADGAGNTTSTTRRVDGTEMALRQ